MSRTLTVNTRTITQQGMQEEHDLKRQAHRQRDILDRLRPAMKRSYSRAGSSWDSSYDSRDDDLRDAGEEIAWLRADRADAVTRGEIVDMVGKLREMQVTIAALLDRIEAGVITEPTPSIEPESAAEDDLPPDHSLSIEEKNRRTNALCTAAWIESMAKRQIKPPF